MFTTPTSTSSKRSRRSVVLDDCNCIKALQKTCLTQGKETVECPKCRKVLARATKEEKENLFAVNSALWNVIQMLFPRLELKSPQWKLPQRPVGSASPMTANLNDSAGFMLRLAEENHGNDPSDLAGEGPELDLTNHLSNLPDRSGGSPVGREGGRADGSRRWSGASAASSAARGSHRARAASENEEEEDFTFNSQSGGAAVPRAGFTTAREMLMRGQNQQRCSLGQQAPHEVMDYA
ncbi:hypothetical protein HOP50_17g80120 [Chloropicon primus]|nr:hypothetical protein HOP50_17g80120 [Chloropicon primus]